jgi:hypothetical protein
MQVARMPDNDWVDEFIQEVKKLAYDIPAPNPYTPMLLAHCLEAERRRAGENYEREGARFRALTDFLSSSGFKPREGADPLS